MDGIPIDSSHKERAFPSFCVRIAIALLIAWLKKWEVWIENEEFWIENGKRGGFELRSENFEVRRAIAILLRFAILSSSFTSQPPWKKPPFNFQTHFFNRSNFSRTKPESPSIDWFKVRSKPTFNNRTHSHPRSAWVTAVLLIFLNKLTTYYGKTHSISRYKRDHCINRS